MSMMPEFSRESEVASHLAREAGDVILRIYGTDFSVDYKAQNDPVTEANRLASHMIVEGLRREFPDDLVVSEEEPIAALASAHDRVWYVDPLDGTREFIKRNGEFAVMIGLAVDGRPRLGWCSGRSRPNCSGGCRSGGVVGNERGNEALTGLQ